MKMIFVIIVSLSFCSILIGQKQIDSLVQKTKKFDLAYQHLIYDYRIPDWGYHRLYLDFSTSLYGNDAKYNPDSYRNHYENSEYSGRFRPYFYLYQTSEKLIFSLYSMMTSNYWYYENRDESETYTQKTIDRNFENTLNVHGNLNQYISRLFYLKYYTTNSFRYYENSDHSWDIDKELNTTSDSKNNYIRREYDLNARFGVGLGRIRNINPVFRALRFTERLKNIGKTTGLSEDELISLIYLYAHESAYSSTYDRSRKYFYEALPERIIEQIKNLQPWEMVYLDESSTEIIGDRNEGLEINGGIQLTHENEIYSGITGSSELTLMGIYAEQKYYHNIASSYQIGTSLDLAYLKAFNENTDVNFLGRGAATFMNLWNMTDRILVEFSLGYETGFASIEAERYQMGILETYYKWHRSDRFRLSLSMDYFLENNLSIGALISNSANKYWTQDASYYYDGYQYSSSLYEQQKNWSVHIDLRYYLIRGMH
jgi:hypothetical protein